MHTRYYKEYSHNLHRDMEFKVYGHAGLPFVVFPCQDGKYFDFESRGMIDTVADKIENGQIQLFCIGCVDEETWKKNIAERNKRIREDVSAKGNNSKVLESEKVIETEEGIYFY